MRWSGWWLLAASSVTFAHGQAEFNVTEPAAGVFVHAGRPLALDAPGHDDIANIGFILGDTCVAVIDTGGSVRIGRALRAAVAARTPLPICYVINTHVHVDHVLGNVAFEGDRPRFVGAAALVQAITRNKAFFLENYANDLYGGSADQVIGPDLTVEHELTLDLGGRLLLLRAWPTAHTDCDLTVYDARTGTLWTGDLLFRERLPALDGSLKGWLSVLDQLARQKAALVVPGHGSLTRDLAAGILPERRYLQALLVGVRDELAQGKGVEDAIRRVAGEQRSDWLLWEQVHPRNVSRAYEELAWE